MQRIMMLTILLGLVACASQPIVIQDGARAVKVAKSDPLDNFEEVGPVSGYDGSGCGLFGSRGSYEEAVTDIKNKAYSMQANYVQIFTITEPHLRGECFDNVYKISGTAYRQVREKQSAIPIINQDKKESLSEKLAELEDLKSKKLISDDEYQKMRQKILLEVY